MCAIIGKKDTIIANVGDSRAYIIEKGRLKQVSKDDSYAQELLDVGVIPSKEAMRFHRYSNLVTAFIGQKENGKCKKLNPQFITLKNKAYEMLLLFSDGITDCLSETDIAVICKNTNRKEIARRLTEKALENKSTAPKEVKGNKKKKKKINPGKDNTTAAVYISER